MIKFTDNERIAIPIGLLVAFIGGVAWLNSMHANGEENTKEIASIKAKQDTHLVFLMSIDRRLAVIEGKLDKQGEE